MSCKAVDMKNGNLHSKPAFIKCFGDVRSCNSCAVEGQNFDEISNMSVLFMY